MPGLQLHAQQCMSGAVLSWYRRQSRFTFGAAEMDGITPFISVSCQDVGCDRHVKRGARLSLTCAQLARLREPQRPNAETKERFVSCFDSRSKGESRMWSLATAQGGNLNFGTVTCEAGFLCVCGKTGVWGGGRKAIGGFRGRRVPAPLNPSSSARKLG